MASIDKIYGTRDQQRYFSEWISINKPEAVGYLYEWSGEWLTDGETHPISNFPAEIDEWLMGNCDIPYILDALKYQYGDNFFQH